MGCRTITGAPQGRVTNIHLTDLELEGPFPASELCALKELRELDMVGSKRCKLHPSLKAPRYQSFDTETDSSAFNSNLAF